MIGELLFAVLTLDPTSDLDQGLCEIERSRSKIWGQAPMRYSGSWGLDWEGKNCATVTGDDSWRFSIAEGLSSRKELILCEIQLPMRWEVSGPAHPKSKKVIAPFVNLPQVTIFYFENMFKLPPHVTPQSVLQSIQGGPMLLYCSGEGIRHLKISHFAKYIIDSPLQPHKIRKRKLWKFNEDKDKLIWSLPHRVHFNLR